MSKLTIKQRKVKDLIPYENNTKLHDDENIDAIAKSIEEFGFINPVIVDEKNRILAGHGRVEAANKIGIKDVPTITVAGLSEVQKKTFTITDNQTTLMTGFDFEKLEEEIRAITEADPDYDLSLTGFSMDAITELLEEEITIEGEIDPDEIPETPTEEDTVIHFGDWIEFPDGSRIVCGDSTAPQTYKQLMGGDKARMINTDPPYGVAYKSDKFDDIANDDLTGDNLRDFLIQTFRLLHAHTIDNPALYIYHASRTQTEFEEALKTAGFRVKQQLIWAKNMFAFGRSDYHWKHEPIFYAVKEEANSEWFGNRSSTTLLTDQDALEDLSKEEIIELIQEASKQSTTWDVSKDPTSSYSHPTQKPVQLAENAIRNSSKPKEIVLEPFSGSGSTLLAAVRADRRCYAVEFEPKYVQVACQRYRDYTGRGDFTINGKAISWDEYE